MSLIIEHDELAPLGRHDVPATHLRCAAEWLHSEAAMLDIGCSKDKAGNAGCSGIGNAILLDFHVQKHTITSNAQAVHDKLKMLDDVPTRISIYADASSVLLRASICSSTLLDLASDKQGR